MIITTIERLHQELVDGLTELQSKRTDPIDLCRDAIKLCLQKIKKSKQLLKKNSFNNERDEITYYKHIQPQLYSHFIYYRDVLKFERRMPGGTHKQKKEYIEEAQNRIDMFFKRNSSLWEYYKSNDTILDHHYFMCDDSECTDFDFAFLDYDGSFTFTQSFLLARFISNQRLLEYCTQKLLTVSDKPFTSNLAPILEFTGSPTDLIELSYALHRSGICKNDIKDIVHALEIIFNTEVQDQYKLYHNIKNRKKDKAKFLNTLIRSLENSILEEL